MKTLKSVCRCNTRDQIKCNRRSWPSFSEEQQQLFRKAVTPCNINLLCTTKSSPSPSVCTRYHSEWQSSWQAMQVSPRGYTFNAKSSCESFATLTPLEMTAVGRETPPELCTTRMVPIMCLLRRDISHSWWAVGAQAPASSHWDLYA